MGVGGADRCGLGAELTVIPHPPKGGTPLQAQARWCMPTSTLILATRPQAPSKPEQGEGSRRVLPLYWGGTLGALC